MSTESATHLFIPDRQAGSAFLSALPLNSPALAQQRLLQFIETLLAMPLVAGETLALLEEARTPVSVVQEEQSRHYLNKALPLATDEEVAFQQAIILWRRMEQAYAMCARLESLDRNHPQYAQLVGTLLQRCLYYNGKFIVEHYRARRELPAGVWLNLHGYYETAEEWGVANAAVEDSLESQPATHCAAAYVTVLLLDIVSPYSHSVRNISLIRRWAALWAPLVSIHPLDDDDELPPYFVELMKDAPLHQTGGAEGQGRDGRWLDTMRLGQEINEKLQRLAAHGKPSELGLGEESRSRVANLLKRLLRPWTQSAAPRRFRRFATKGGVRVVQGFAAMHHAISKKAFIQPDSMQAYSRDDFDSLFTFRDRVNPGAEMVSKAPIDFPADDWAVINHSASGFRLIRRAAVQRVAHAQLLAVMPHDGENYLLCRASWLMQASDGGLVAGVAVLPGMPEGIGIRIAGGVDRYVQAFMLPPVPAIKEAGSLVIPPGMYMTQRLMDVYVDREMRQLRLLNVIERGFDYERISYEPA